MASEYSRKMAVGGILAHSQYDIKGETDLCIVNRDGEVVAVFEFKTPEEFTVDNWYRKCRGSQLLTALYLTLRHFW